MNMELKHFAARSCTFCLKCRVPIDMLSYAQTLRLAFPAESKLTRNPLRFPFSAKARTNPLLVISSKLESACN